MVLEHITDEEFYRYPFGALTCGMKVRLRLSVKDAGFPAYVRVIYKTDSGTEIYADMPYVFSVQGASIYEKELEMPDTACLVWYYFELATDAGVVCCGNGGMCEKENVHAFQITVYNEDYKTPDWFKTAVAYQIFPDRFCNPDGEFLGNRTDIIKRNWGDTPFYSAEQFGGGYKSNDFFGGNLEGIISKLPYLEDMGITVIYLNPIFKAASNHKYDTGSYEEIDPMFGDEETFSRLCSEAKKRGIRIILDGVFNHTGDDSLYFNKYGSYDSVGAYQSKESPYFTWFNFIDHPDKYESWWGMTTLPQVNEESKELREYLLSGENSIVKKWIRLGASGWRLDVVDELPDFFVKELRSAVKSVNPEAVIIGEVWEDASNKVAYGKRREYFNGDELDSVMNYPFRNALIDAMLCRIDADEFNRRIMSIKENYPTPAYYSTLNMISSHDVERIVTLMSGAPTRHEIDRHQQAEFSLSGESLELALKRTRAVYAIAMTMPGVPCIFYGDELGVQGYGDPFCRSCFPWEKMDEVDPDSRMRNYIKQLIALRKSSRAFSVGELHNAYSVGNTYCYVRSYNDEKYVVVANFDGKRHDIRLDVARFGITELNAVFSDGDIRTHHKSDAGMFFVDALPYSVAVYKCN
ncbi:MAG: glycoside hydrolase family 13 protein [Clostridia bacterium]|nr:glycoside hydrolase family 13 protein [Clostridia bacterium]